MIGFASVSEVIEAGVLTLTEARKILGVEAEVLVTLPEDEDAA